jgi:hypothetical protein
MAGDLAKLELAADSHVTGALDNRKADEPISPSESVIAKNRTIKAGGTESSMGARHRHVPELKNRVYCDGEPVHQLQYLQVKLILKGDRFVSSQALRDFSQVVEKAAMKADVSFDTGGFEDVKPRLREVLFLDTPDFLLYKNAFILRRRFLYEDGFLIGDPEIVFKYRHPDLQAASEVDVRPRITGDYRVKFKAEALPLKNRLGGFRMLYSHNVQFPLSAVRQVDRRSMASVLEILPALQALNMRRTGRIELVNNAAVEEILVDLGHLDFGKGVDTKANVSLWRTRGDLQQLVGEFAFQIKFRRRQDLPDKALTRCEKFFSQLQQVAKDWIALGTTKTGTVYRLKGPVSKSSE